MFGRSKKSRRRRSSETVEPVVQQHRSHSRPVPKRLLIPVWLLVISNFVFLLVGMFYLGGQQNEAEDETVLLRENVHTSLYQQVIADAAYVGPERVSYQLFPVEQNALLDWQEFQDEDWLKVVLWISEAAYQQRFADAGDEIQHTATELPTEFVTLYPQLQRFCRRFPIDGNYQVDFRLKQYLGLDPNRRYERIVELWVPAEDLFRPCPDPETDDRFCQLEPGRTDPQVKNIANYGKFLRHLSLQSYHDEGRPWTRLGYTYDWAYGEHGVGASEYMMVPEARYRLAGSYSTSEYCQR